MEEPLETGRETQSAPKLEDAAAVAELKEEVAAATELKEDAAAEAATQSKEDVAAAAELMEDVAAESPKRAADGDSGEEPPKRLREMRWCYECDTDVAKEADPLACSRCNGPLHTEAEKRVRDYQQHIFDTLCDHGIFFSDEPDSDESFDAFLDPQNVDELWWVEQPPSYPRAVTGVLALRIAKGAMGNTVFDDKEYLPRAYGKHATMGKDCVGVYESHDWNGKEFVVEQSETLPLAAFLAKYPTAQNWRRPKSIYNTAC